ncbi:MAG: helix-turn-helix domain-containing protein [Dissulfurispiraceae bacterium]
MIIRKGYKFRLNTSPAEEVLMRQFTGCSRFLWNKARILQKECLDNKQGYLSYRNERKGAPDEIGERLLTQCEMPRF